MVVQARQNHLVNEKRPNLELWLAWNEGRNILRPAQQFSFVADQHEVETFASAERGHIDEAGLAEGMVKRTAKWSISVTASGFGLGDARGLIATAMTPGGPPLGDSE